MGQIYSRVHIFSDEVFFKILKNYIAKIDHTSYERAACFHYNEAKQLFFFWKQKFKMADLKEPHFPAPPILNIFFFMKILWIGPWASRINWCKGHWCGSTYMVVSWGCPTYAQKQPKNTKVTSEFFLASSQWKQAALSYEISFISAESWKSLHPKWYAHDCSEDH